MDAIKFETTVDETVADAMPKLRPMLGLRVGVIALATAGSSAIPKSGTLDEFLANRLKRSEDVDPVTLEDMQSAIVQGVMGGDV